MRVCRHGPFSHTTNVACPAECARTYPIDPLTAEDPCEDCGRDQRKHDIDMRGWNEPHCLNCGRAAGRADNVDRCAECW